MRTGDQHHQRLEAEALPTTPSYKWISTLFAANSSRAQGTWVRGQEEQQAPCGPETPEAQPVGTVQPVRSKRQGQEEL